MLKHNDRRQGQLPREAAFISRRQLPQVWSADRKAGGGDFPDSRVGKVAPLPGKISQEVLEFG